MGCLTILKYNINLYDNVQNGKEKVDVDSFPNIFNNFMSSIAAHVKPFDCNILYRLRENLMSCLIILLLTNCPFSVF